MLSPDDKRRIEEEERYRAQIRKKLGPVETTSFINKVAKFFVWWFILTFVIAAVVAVVTVTPKKF